ncbi:hypothetical protein TNCV_3812591 [Trichonephila clavipes]|nr:hypothetical protein TNCV_3812591 [Trichonephila clavipes]
MQVSHHRRRECRTLANTPGISRVLPATTVILAPGSCRGLRKENSSYGFRERGLGRRDQASAPANLLNHPVQSIALDMLYRMHFAHQR